MIKRRRRRRSKSKFVSPINLISTLAKFESVTTFLILYKVSYFYLRKVIQVNQILNLVASLRKIIYIHTYTYLIVYINYENSMQEYWCKQWNNCFILNVFGHPMLVCSNSIWVNIGYKNSKIQYHMASFKDLSQCLKES